MPKSDIGQRYRNTFVRSNHVVVVLSYYYRIIFYIYYILEWHLNHMNGPTAPCILLSSPGTGNRGTLYFPFFHIPIHHFPIPFPIPHSLVPNPSRLTI